MTLIALLQKDASFDYHCANTANQGIMGYDMVTKLGSNLHITKTTANIVDYDLLEIVRQNFGFDLINGIRTVMLSGEQEHYYLEVMRKDVQNKRNNE